MMRATCVVVMVLVLTLAGVAGAQENKKSPPTRPGSTEAPITPMGTESAITNQIYLGGPAPDFELDGSRGRPVRLEHEKGYWLLIVFADSRTSLAPLKSISGDLRKLGVHAFGVCADKAHVLEAYAEKQQLPFVLLADVTGEISQLYGLYDSKARMIRPGFVILDRQGIVRTALFGQAVPADEVLDMVKFAVTGS